MAIQLKEQTAPGTPSSGVVAVYAKSDGRMYYKDDTGTEVAMTQSISHGTKQATTSGTSKDWTGIPAGVNRVKMYINGLSTSGTAYPRFQLGISSGPVTSGYLGGSAYAGGTNQAGGINPTAGFDLPFSNAANVLYGVITFTRLEADGTVWIADGMFAASSSAYVAGVSGAVDLGAELDRVRLTTSNGTDTLDAGSANITYEY